MGPNERRDSENSWEPEPLHLPLSAPETKGRDTGSSRDRDDETDSNVIVIDIS